MLSVRVSLVRLVLASAMLAVGVLSAFPPSALPQAAAQENPATDARTKSQPQVARVTRNKVNVRSGPSVDFYALAELPKDALVVVLGPEPGATDWLRVRVPGGVPVYVFADLLHRSKEDDLVGAVAATRVLMRATASKAYYPVNEQHLRASEEVVVLADEASAADGASGAGEGGAWVRVIAPRRIHAWIHRDLVATLGPLTDHSEAIATAGAKRLDALTGGRWSARERARQAERTRVATTALDAIAARVEQGSATTDDLRALQQARGQAPTEPLRKRAASLAARMLSDKEDRAKQQRDDALRRARDEADARRRAQEAAARKYQQTRRELEAKQRAAKPAADAEGVIERVDRALRLRVSAGQVLLLRSRRFRLGDYIGKRVRVRGKTRGGEPLATFEVTHLEVVR